MKESVINKIQNGQVLLTLLNPKVSPFTIINDRNYKEFNIKELIVDTAVKNKLSKYRFMSLSVDDTGNVNRDSLKYFIPDSNLLVTANVILSQYDFELGISFMTKSQIQKIKLDALFSDIEMI